MTGLSDIFKTLLAFYMTVWLLLLQKVRGVYQLDGNKLSFGVFLKLVGVTKNEDKVALSRSVSVPTMQRSTSIRERRRFLSDRGAEKTSGSNSYSSQHFNLRKRSSTAAATMESAPQAEPTTMASTANPGLLQNEVQGKIKFTCKKSLLMAKGGRKSR